MTNVIVLQRPRWITYSAFQTRLSPEWAALELFATDNPNLPDADRLTRAKVRAWRDLARGSAYIDLDDSRLRSGLLDLVALGLLTEARMEEILGADVIDLETP